VHRVVVHRDRLEGRGVGVGQGAAGGPEDLADAQVLERPGRDDQERVGVEVGNSSHRALSALEMILDNFIVERVIGLVDVAEHNAAFLSVSVLTTAALTDDLIDNVIDDLQAGIDWLHTRYQHTSSA
jgi:hypothetical protein